MEEYRLRQKQIGKNIAKILAYGIGFAVIVSLIKAVAEAVGLEYRACTAAIIWTGFILTAFALVGCILWFLCVLFCCPLKKRMCRIGLKLVCVSLVVVIIAGTVCGCFVTYLVAAFSLNDEKTAVVSGTKYVARLETTGWESTGISYHKIVGLIFCEKSGWEVDFDSELWRSYD